MCQDHTELDYALRIRDESKLLFTLDKLMEVTQDFGGEADQKVAKLAMTKLEFIYYKTDAQSKLIEDRLKDRPEALKETYLVPQPSRATISALVANIEYYGKTRLKIRAYLLQVYHFAIHNNYKQARELLLKLHVSDFIHTQDANT